MSDEISGTYMAVDVSSKNSMDTKNLYMTLNLSANKQSPDTYTTVDYENTYKGKTSSKGSVNKSNNGDTVSPSTDGTTDFQEGRGNKDKQIKNILHGKSPLWMLCILLALIAFNVVTVGALTVAFSVTAGHSSEIAAIKESLNYRCQQLYLSNVLFLNKSEMSFLKLSQETTSRIHVMDEAILYNLQVLKNLSILLNESRSQMLLQYQLLHRMISKRFFNFSVTLKKINDEFEKKTRKC